MRKYFKGIGVALFTLMFTTNVNAATLQNRLSGSDRYQTNSKIVQQGWTTSEYAIIASGEGFADALCAAPLAKKYNAPILLTEKNALNLNAKNELTKLDVKNVFIVGGTGVISDNVKSKIELMGIKTNRIYGKDRFETSLQVAKHLGDTNSVVVTNGLGFADALSIAPVAAQNGIPILLTDKSDLSNQIKDFLSNKTYEKSYIVGGSAVVSDKIASQLDNVIRLAGNSRYKTNAAVLNHFSNEFSYDKVYVASGENYPDALSGSVLAASYSSPLILVGKSVDSEVMSSVKAHHEQYNNIIVLGGTGVVGDSLANTVVSGVVSVISVSLNKASNTLSVGAKDTLTANVFPSNAQNKDVKWTSSNNAVATVDATGKVTAISKGTAIITATTVDGNKKANCTVTVKDKVVNKNTPKISAPIGEPILCPSGLGFLKDYADGIKVCWMAKNQTGKTINYYTVNISMYNPVGDPAYCEIKRSSKIPVNYVGPVLPNGTMVVYSTVAYSGTCSKIVIDSIQVKYSDGTSETIPYGYSGTETLLE